MMKLWIAFGLTFCLTAQADLGQPDRTETTVDREGYINQCEWFSKTKPYALCITTKIGSRNRDVLYYMHGASGNEKRWLKRYGDVRAAWDRDGFDPPATVTLSFGPVWLMAEKNEYATSGVFEYIADTVMPAIEERLGGLQGRRLLIGESMGGFNVAQLIMKRRGRFARGAILCPAITHYGPYTPVKELKEFAKRVGAKKTLVYWSVIMQRVFFPDMDTWAKASPLIFGHQALDSSTPPLLVTCGRQDEWGFFDGAQRFAELASSKGVPIQWEPLDGKHCTFDPETVADFLSQ